MKLRRAAPPDPAPPDPAERLAASGLRATQQRISVLALIDGHRGHPTALEVHEALAPRHPGLSAKTVYEILDALVEAGLARRITQVAGPARYEARLERHYHAHCRACGRLVDVPASADAAIRGRVALPSGFALEGIHVTLEGRCARCAR